MNATIIKKAQAYIAEVNKAENPFRATSLYRNVLRALNYDYKRTNDLIDSLRNGY